MRFADPQMLFTDPRMRSPSALGVVWNGHAWVHPESFAMRESMGRYGATPTAQAVTVLPPADSLPATLPPAPSDAAALMGQVIADLSAGYTAVQSGANPANMTTSMTSDVSSSLDVINAAIQSLSGSGMVSVLSADGAPFASPAEAWNAWADLATQTQQKLQQLNVYAGTWTLTHVSATIGKNLNPFAPGGILDPGPGGGFPIWGWAIIGVVGLGAVAYITGQVGVIAKVFSGAPKRKYRRSRR